MGVGGRGSGMLSAQISQPALCQLTCSLLHCSSHTKPGFRYGEAQDQETRAGLKRGGMDGERDGERERERWRETERGRDG